MLYIVRAYEDGHKYEYEYGDKMHAIEHYKHEKTAKIVAYDNGKEKIVKEKFNNIEKARTNNEKVYTLRTSSI
jgi:hypothetical protein